MIVGTPTCTYAEACDHAVAEAGLEGGQITAWGRDIWLGDEGILGC